jgi:cobalt-zinc-cadmium efflux system protein
VNILLEGVPRDVDYQTVEKLITEKPGVLSIHDLHIWTLTSGIYALSVHVIMDPETKLMTATELSESIKAELVETFKITHTTIEIHTDKTGYVSNII